MAISDQMKERVSDQGEALSTMGFSLEGGRALATYDLTVEEELDIQEAVTYILGTTQIETAGLRLNRTPPLAHPQFPFLYASSITSIKGRGKYELVPSDPALEVPPFPSYALYSHYEITVEFTPRPYPVLDNTNTPQGTNCYVGPTGTKYFYNYAAEWLRYCDYEYQPKFDSITQVQGLMRFRTPEGTTQPVGPPPENTFEGIARMYLPDQMLKITWYAVPYRFVTSPNSVLAFYLGRINQGDWYNWKKGELLYVGFNPKRYTPPIQDIALFNNVPSTEKLCNLELVFIHTHRELGIAPSTTPPPQFVVGGHNLLPWMPTRKFYYATTRQTTVPPDPGTPSFLSFPIEQLFTDPDAFDAGLQPAPSGSPCNP